MSRFATQFNGIPIVEQAITGHGGDARAAEAEAWEAWELDGKKEHSPYKFLAIGIAETKWVGKEVG